VISWINRSLITQIAQSAIYIDNTRDLWEDLKERFSKSNHFHTSDLLQEINSIRKGERSISSITQVPEYCGKNWIHYDPFLHAFVVPNALADCPRSSSNTENQKALCLF